MLDLVKGFGLAVLLLLPLHLLDRCSVDRKARREQDAVWVEKIRASSGRVKAVLEASDIELEAEDKVSLEKLDAEQARRDKELQELRTRRTTIQISEHCRLCRVPAERLRIH